MQLRQTSSHLNEPTQPPKVGQIPPKSGNQHHPNRIQLHKIIEIDRSPQHALWQKVKDETHRRRYWLCLEVIIKTRLQPPALASPGFDKACAYADSGAQPSEQPQHRYRWRRRIICIPKDASYAIPSPESGKIAKPDREEARLEELAFWWEDEQRNF